MKGLDELRHKESDRIKSIVGMLKSFKIKTEIKKNDIKIYGSPSKEVTCYKTVKVYSDHRIALSASILGIISNNQIKLDDKGKSMATSYPNFNSDINKLITN
jgi:3-phosphoshikimate 1-carboxyvinyltransferase